MANKLDFYDRYGVEEYYIYDSDRHALGIWTRQGGDRSASASALETAAASKSELASALVSASSSATEPALNFKPVPGRQDQRPRLIRQSHIHGWTSPLLGVRFAMTPETLLLLYPNGQPFLTSVELARRAEEASARAEQEAMRADAEHTRAERLAERLRALGIDPESP